MRKLSSFWAVQLWILGLWEAAAFLFRPVPTITSTVRRIRNRRLARLAIIVWAGSLTNHLLRSKERG